MADFSRYSYFAGSFLSVSTFLKGKSNVALSGIAFRQRITTRPIIISFVYFKLTFP